MPGNMAIANPSTVMPITLSRVFSELREFPVIVNDAYADGRTQRNPQALSGRKSWRVSKSLTLTEWTALKAFYLARRGCLEPFYAYFERSKYDASGIAADGRYIVVFSGAISESYGISRSQVDLSLLEVA